ncbi:hypothetical protein D0Z07_2959 [Hyphodiscus hymeniophilus]|uniref:CFEM domain-containing protein n=1 Tax=Hyphodiscus hymeniophilus TaxID=353542 RepID=A0A9P6VLP3_9HELO|nr:hypothetical protein D0Z07_2959 [Hyphodiscus hymeniophilus]
MRTSLSTVVALASTLQVASATGWTDASAFSCPSNTDNHCSSQQSSGFDWSSLNLGSFSSYGGFSFEGFSCSSSFGGSGKRDTLSARSFQDKCITGTASSDKSSCPSFSCGGDVSAFSVDEFQVSVEFDCSLEFHYGMSDGSTCKQTSPCSKSGTTIKNTQCGGAKNVTVVYPSPPSGGGKSTCSIGVHSIGFDCSTASSTVHQSSTTSLYTKPTSQVTKPASSAAQTTSVPSLPETTPISIPASSSSIIQTTPASPSSAVPSFSNSSVAITPVSSPAVSTPVQLTTSTVFSTSISTVISCGPEITNCPARSTVLTTVIIPVSTTICPVTATETSPVSTPESSSSIASSPSSSIELLSSTGAASSSTIIISTPAITSPESSAAATSSSGIETSPAVSEVITTEIIYTSTTICPVTATQTSNGVTSTSVGVSTSTILLTSTSTICTKCDASATESLASSASVGLITSSTVSAPASTETLPCPDVLPQCLNTWLYTTGCNSNTDSECYCPSSSFVSTVFECLSAHGASSDEVASAQTYFQGICAAHVSSNPAIVTAASTITLSASSGGVFATSVPVTTVQVLTTLTVPCTESTGVSSGSIIAGSSTTTVLSTAVTVPQVQFTTVLGATTAAAGLVPASTQASQAAGVTIGVPAAASGISAATTLASIGVSNATITSSLTPTSAVPFTGAGSRTGMALGSIGAAVLFAVFAM